MARTVTAVEAVEITDLVNATPIAYRNGWCSLSDAQMALTQPMFAALRGDPAFRDEVRGYSRMFLRDA